MARRIIFVLIVVIVFVAVLFLVPSSVKQTAGDGSDDKSNASVHGSNNSTFIKSYIGKQTAAQAKPPEIDPEAPVDTPPEPKWRTEAHAYLFTDDPEAVKAKKFMDSLPTMPLEGQIEITEFWTRLVTDQGYSYTSNVVVNPSTPEPVLSVLMRDLLVRDNELKLPIILEVARSSKHPLQNEAVEILGATLHADYGTDWKEWQNAVQNWLKLTHVELN
ncbi:MAG: hypothetical protein JWN25_2719 [Verrucomicrobiales bacterium]|nr:hypothetical protein [Verrucomicrobiales bacterium]